MKKVKESTETKKSTRFRGSVRELSASELQHTAGGDGDSGTKPPHE